MLRTSAVLATALVVILLVHPPAGPVAAAQVGGVCGPNPGPPNPADPAIRVSAPAPGARVTSPLQVSGQARVFEATVSLALLNAVGRTIAEGFTTAEAGAPALAPFSTTLAFTVTTETPACLWVFEASARDGSPINVVQIPLTLLPSAGPTETVPLFPGCNNVTMTWSNGAPIETVAAAVSPAGALRAIWLYVPLRQGFFGWSPLPGAPVDLLAVSRLDAVFICMNAPGTLARPRV